MLVIPKHDANFYPVWLAIHDDKVVCAQEQEHAVQCFIGHYGYAPSVVINGLYATKEKKSDGNNASGRGLGPR